MDMPDQLRPKASSGTVRVIGLEKPDSLVPAGRRSSILGDPRKRDFR